MSTTAPESPGELHEIDRPPYLLEPERVTLSVGDLERSVSFYERALGMATLERDGGRALLGVDGRGLLELLERPGVRGVASADVGLFHFAVLLPSRAELGRWLRHAGSLGIRIGQSDHLVSEAFYLADPDGHGIEMYRDRPRGEWRWSDGSVRMANEHVDVAGLLEAAGTASFERLPDGTTLGHVHLKVASLAAAEPFYTAALGFEVTARWPGALFVSTGGYHHHVGLNEWLSLGGRTSGEGTARLERVAFAVRDEEHFARIVDLADASSDTDGVEVIDPSGNALVFRLADA